MAAGYVPRLKSTEHGTWSMERRAGSREKAQKINIEHRTPNTEHRTPNTEHRTPNTEHRTSNIERGRGVGSTEQGAGRVGVLEYWSAGAAKTQTK
jgi:hypothetical protein